MPAKPNILAFAASCACLVFHRCSAFQLGLSPRTSRRRQRSGLFCSTEDQNDPVLRLPLLESELATMPPAGDDEASEDRRKDLEEAVDNARTAAEFGVRRAQVNFYDAFSRSDYASMERVWSDEVPVRCVHPGMSALEGKDDVMRSWAQIFSQGEGFKIEPARVSVEICGRTAIVSCIEETPNGGKLEALNIYRREGGSWCVTLHMAAPIMVRQ